MDNLFDHFASGCGASDPFWERVDQACKDDEVLSDLVERQASFVRFCLHNGLDKNDPEAQRIELTVGRDWTARVFNELIRRTLKLKELGVPASFFELDED